MIHDTITNCLKIVGDSIALGKYPPAMQIISFDQHDIFTSIRQLYVLASLEANYSNHTYYDKTNSAGIPLRTYDEKWFHIFSGKLAEIELSRKAYNRGCTIKEGPEFFTGKPDSGKDQVIELYGPIQVKYGHGDVFKIDLAKFSDYADKGCRLALLKSDEFYDDFHPRSSKDPDYLSWRCPQIPPTNHYSWDEFEIDLHKVLNDKITSLDISYEAISDKSYEYVSWFRW